MPTTPTIGFSAPAAAAGAPGDDDPDQPPERSRRPDASVCIHDETGALHARDLDWLREAAGRALAAALPDNDDRPHELRARIVGDGAMAALHQRHAGDPATTDVLTFDLRDDPRLDPLDADVVVCLDEARRRSEERAEDTRRELLLYILHAALHCLGHDDHDPADARAMHAREDEILTRIGVGPVYAPARSPQGDDPR